MSIMNKYKPNDERYHFEFNGVRDGGKRMGKTEQDEITRLFGALNMLIDVVECDGFDRRLEMVPRGRARLKQASTIFKHLLEDIMNTAPEEQVLHMCRQMCVTRYLTYVGKCSPVKINGEEGRWMSFNELNGIANIAREHCLVCTLTDRKDMKHCPINTFMNVMPIDRPETGMCGWLEVLGDA